VAPSFLYRLVRHTIELLGVHRLSGIEKDVEIIVLRHQLQVLQRCTPRPRFTWADRAFLALAGGPPPPPVVVATRDPGDGPGLATQDRPEALELSASGPGRPPLPDEQVELICRLARENPRWASCDHGRAAQPWSGRIRHRHGLPPAPRGEGPTWSDFLRSQAHRVLATDFTPIDAVTGQRYYALFVIEIERRVVHLLGVTTTPNGQWVTQMARKLAWDLQEAKRTIGFLIRDRDTKFTAAFDEVLRAEGIESIRTPVRAPRAKGLASHCTSWGWLGCFSLRESSAARWNEPRITRGGRLEEMLVLVVGLVADEEAGMMPGLDGVPLHAEMRGDLVEGEQAGSSKPVPVAQKVMVAA
jgi:putative transposase